MLMDSRLVRESVRADDRFRREHFHPGYRREQPRRPGDFLRADAAFESVIVFSRLKPHHDFFQRGISRPFADAADRALDPLFPPDL